MIATIAEPKVWPRLSLQRAELIARNIEAALAPFCSRIEVAGSIRRRRQSVGDIDLVCEPLPGSEHLLRERLERNTLAREGQRTPKCNVLRWMIVKGEPVALGVFLARLAEPGMFAPTPGNWASLYLCRTGSVQHNIRFASRARALGLHWDPYRGLIQKRDGLESVIETPNEEDLYQALSLEWVAPQNREAVSF